MTRLSNAHLTTAIPSRDAVLWRAYDEQGWSLSADDRDNHKLARAKLCFQQAIEIADGFPANDYRRGRSLAGLAWTLYRFQSPDLESIDPPDETPADAATATFQEIRTTAEKAIQLLRDGDVPRSERVYLARAYHVHGMALVELCNGAAAEDSLKEAARYYRELQLNELSLEVVMWQAKLLQCRRQFAQAIALFQQVVQTASDAETQLAALTDLANTLIWTGHVREAAQLQAAWRRLEKQLNRLPDVTRPVELLFRARLVFARVNMLYGDFSAAEEYLQVARQSLCKCSKMSPACTVVLCIVEAELAIYRGQLSCVPAGFCKQELEELSKTASDQGCLDILAIDACCQIGVVESCIREVVRKHCFFRRHACRVVFTKTTTFVLQPVDVTEILRAIIVGLRAGWAFQAGRFLAAQSLFAESVAEIKQQVDKESPLLLPLLAAQIDVAQSLRKDHTKVDELLTQAADIVRADGVSPHIFEAKRYWALANERIQRGEYEVAASLFRKSLKHGTQFRQARHPSQQFTLIQAAFAAAITHYGDEDIRESPTQKGEVPGCAVTGCEQQAARRMAIHSSLDTTHAALSVLSEHVGCDDYRLLVGRTLASWLCLLAGQTCSATSGFDRLQVAWQARDARLNALFGHHRNEGEIPKDNKADPRQGLSLLGQLAIRIQCGDVTCPEYGSGEAESAADPFTPYEELMEQCAAWSREQIAAELYRLAALLCWASLEQAAMCFCRKADSLEPDHPPIVYPSHSPTLRHHHGQQRSGLLRRIGDRIRSRRSR